MKQNKKNLNREVNYHLGIALGYFELLLIEIPGLRDNAYGSQVLETLLRSYDLSSELTLASMNDGDNTLEILKDGFKKISVQEHFIKNVKPSYEKLKDEYDIKIKLKITIIDEEKFSYVNLAVLKRIRENLICNAINAGATHLDVHLEMKECCVTVTFKDNGEGMIQEELDKVFLSQHGDGIVPGAGTRSILDTAKDPGLSISFSSQKGKGTTVRVLVPYCEKSLLEYEESAMKKNKKVFFLNHDVNNDLGVALGYFELLLDETPNLQDNPDASHMLEAVLRSHDLSSELALIGMEDGGDTPEILKNGFTIRSVQEHFLKNTKPSYEKLKTKYDIKINLKITVIGEEKFFYVNPIALIRLRENIVSNAINAGATQLNVHLEMKEYCVIVTYKDNGKGMTEEELDKVFLYQHGDVIVHGEGTRSILDTAKEHGYSITYSSQNGKGTTIKALVPYCEQPLL